MKLCDKCKARNLNSATECESCGAPIAADAKIIETAEEVHQKKVLAALENINYNLSKLTSEEEKGVSVRGVSMSISDMAILIIKWMIASIPAASIAFIAWTVVFWLIWDPTTQF